MTSFSCAKIPHGDYSILCKDHASFSQEKKNYKMAEELQQYKDILKREREEFKRQLVREVGTS